MEVVKDFKPAKSLINIGDILEIDGVDYLVYTFNEVITLASLNGQGIWSTYNSLKQLNERAEHYDCTHYSSHDYLLKISRI